MENKDKKIMGTLQALSDTIDINEPSIAMILAAGHGKRIKSETSKMIHKIWGVPTVLRVSTAAHQGLGADNQIIVVGVKAPEVAEACGRSKNRIFEYQAEQNGTGHAVRIGLRTLENIDYTGTVFVFPGDVGLLNAETVRSFKEAFQSVECDMMVLTSLFKGDSADNYYGRIIRVPAQDVAGKPAGDDEGKVIEIKEHKDILEIQENEPYVTAYNNKKYAFTREELIELREFNSGIYAFRAPRLKEYVTRLQQDNVQGELYITDLIAIYNRAGLSVRAHATFDENAVLGFNVKSVLKQMESIARADAYEKLKDTISIADKDDFFIADEVIEHILEMDRKEGPLDIEIGKGASIGSNVRFSKKVAIHSRVQIFGNVTLGENVHIMEDVELSTYDDQTMSIGKGTEILKGNFIKGNLTTGENCRIESSVNMTGADDAPVRIGNNVLIKGTSYIYGCIIEDDIWIEHSVLKNKLIERTVRNDGTVQGIRWVLPQPQGMDSIFDVPSVKNSRNAQ